MLMKRRVLPNRACVRSSYLSKMMYLVWSCSGLIVSPLIFQGLESLSCHVDRLVNTLSSEQIGQTIPGVTLIRRKALHQ